MKIDSPKNPEDIAPAELPKRPWEGNGMKVAGHPPQPTEPIKVKHITDAIAELNPPDYLIKGLIARSYIYSLTAATGAGKTCLMIYLALLVATGRELFGKQTKKGRVLYLIGENPDDTLPRFGVAATHHGINLSELDLHVTTQLFNLDKTKIEIGTDLEKLGKIDLVFVDTGPAFFSHFGATDGENSNDDMIKFAHALRKISNDLEGNPTVIAAMHPSKNATQKVAMIPRGGSAFTNEVDGNFCLTTNDGGNTSEMHWMGKIRGVDFEPMPFRNMKSSQGGVRDADGEPITSVYARPMSEDEALNAEQKNKTNRERVLEVMNSVPEGIGQSDIGRRADMVNDHGELKRSSVHKVIAQLVETKEAEFLGGGLYRLTAKGKKSAKGSPKGAD